MPEQLLSMVADLYYRQDLSQNEIAQRLGVSRPNVSRMLKKARELGIVEIRIKLSETDATRSLERELTGAYGIRSAKVIPTLNNQTGSFTAIGDAAADLFLSHVRHESVVGCSWGLSLMYMLEAIHLTTVYDKVEVVQLLGGTPQQMAFPDGSEFAARLSQALHCSCNYLLAPVLAPDHAAREMMVKQASVQTVLEKGRRSDIALIGIGAIDNNSLLRNKLIDSDDVVRLQKAGAAAEICACFIDRNGNPVDCPPNDRTLTIGTDSLRAIPTVIAVALGPAKQEAMTAVLKGGYVDILVTDQSTATAVLRHAK